MAIRPVRIGEASGVRSGISLCFLACWRGGYGPAIGGRGGAAEVDVPAGVAEVEGGGQPGTGDGGAGAGLAERVEENVAIGVAAEGVCAAVRDVIEGAGRFDACAAGHR